jgi:hypothetical protein
MESSMQEQLMLFAGDTPASPSAKPEENKAKMTRATSGRRCGESFEKHAPAGSLPRMFVDMLASVSTPLPHNWKMKASPSGRLLFQLAPSVPRSGGIDCGLWATPQARDYMPAHKPEYIAKQKAKGHGMRNLNDEVQMWPTPTATRRSGLQSHGKNAILGTLNPQWVEWLMGYPLGWTDLKPSETLSCLKSPNSSVA